MVSPKQKVYNENKDYMAELTPEQRAERKRLVCKLLNAERVLRQQEESLRYAGIPIFMGTELFRAKVVKAERTLEKFDQKHARATT